MADFKKLFQTFNKERSEIFCGMPSKKLAQEFIEEYINFLFPINLGRNMCELESEATYNLLHYKLKELLLPIRKQLNKSVDDITAKFFKETLSIYTSLLKDAKAIERFDPAAYSISEVIVAYPGFFAVTVYRVTHVLYNLAIPIVPRLISEYAHSRTGIDIHPGATIGSSFFIDHGTGIVIGETTTIHNNVKIYQGVTLGALSVAKKLSSKKRHPTIEDNVIIYANATILGGKTVIGHDSVIGGNTWITESVPPNSLVINKADTKVRNKNNP
jgi:serine O-acetyltransferase